MFRIALVLTIMATEWIAYVIDVKGAFLHGELEDGEVIMHMKVLEGFEQFYPLDVLLSVKKAAMYGTKQGAIAFWRQLLRAMKDMKMNQNAAEPCCYFKWTDLGLVIWLSHGSMTWFVSARKKQY